MTKANGGNPEKNKPGNNPAPKDSQTSGDREESMNESDKDAFGKQSSARSGTTSLGGDSAASSDKPGPGGVEGTGGTN